MPIVEGNENGKVPPIVRMTKIVDYFEFYKSFRHFGDVN